MSESKSPMLRVSREDDCLWVCDLPRRAANAEAVCITLTEMGFSVTLDKKSLLWKIDVLDYVAIDKPTPDEVGVPSDEDTHTAYTLFRLLRAHPAALDEQPVELIRSILKACELPPAQVESRLAEVHAQCAARLRRHQPLPAAAAGILYDYIKEGRR